MSQYRYAFQEGRSSVRPRKFQSSWKFLRKQLLWFTERRLPSCRPLALWTFDLDLREHPATVTLTSATKASGHVTLWLNFKAEDVTCPTTRGFLESSTAEPVLQPKQPRRFHATKLPRSTDGCVRRQPVQTSARNRNRNRNYQAMTEFCRSEQQLGPVSDRFRRDRLRVRTRSRQATPTTVQTSGFLERRRRRNRCLESGSSASRPLLQIACGRPDQISVSD